LLLRVATGFEDAGRQQAAGKSEIPNEIANAAPECLGDPEKG